MKNFGLLCFLLLASACVLVARAEEETPDVDAPKMEDQPETADVTADVNDENKEIEADEAQTESDEDETEANDETEDENGEAEEDEEETTDVADDEPEKRGWRCKRYRRGKLWCRACGCRRVCKPKVCTRRFCRRVRCYKKRCYIVTRYRIVKYKYRNPYYNGYGSLYLWKTKKVPYKVRVCKNVRSSCRRCYKKHYSCPVCWNVCKYRRCQAYYG